MYVGLALDTRYVYNVGLMRLPEYIRQVGATKFAKTVGAKRRTVLAWQYMTRYPNREAAKKIVERTPVTMEGIYGS